MKAGIRDQGSGIRKALKPKRICVMQGQQKPETECRMNAGKCMSRSHGHVALVKAQMMVAEGLANWIGNAIHLEPLRRWRKRISRAGAARVAVMQLVP